MPRGVVVEIKPPPLTHGDTGFDLHWLIGRQKTKNRPTPCKDDEGLGFIGFKEDDSIPVLPGAFDFYLPISNTNGNEIKVGNVVDFEMEGSKPIKICSAKVIKIKEANAFSKIDFLLKTGITISLTLIWAILQPKKK